MNDCPICKGKGWVLGIDSQGDFPPVMVPRACTCSQPTEPIPWLEIAALLAVFILFSMWLGVTE